MNIKQLNDYLYSIAPIELCMEGDNTGIMIGQLSMEVKKVLVALDATVDTIDRALSENANVVLTHHPLFFSGVKCITDSDRVGRVALKAIKNDIAILSHHTNIDMANGGLNDTFAKMIGGKNVTLTNEGAIFSLDTTLDGLAKEIKNQFGSIRVSGNVNEKIKRAFVITGAGGRDLEALNYAKQNADVFITGEIKHNFLYDRDDLAIIEIPHFASEIICLEVFEKMLKGLDIEVVKDIENPPYVEY